MVDKDRLDDPHVKTNLLLQVRIMFSGHSEFGRNPFSTFWIPCFPVIFFITTLFFVVAQAHFSQLELPISDYVTDLKSVLDQSIRVMQAMIDICANSGWLFSAITCMNLLQMVMQVPFKSFISLLFIYFL